MRNKWKVLLLLFLASFALFACNNGGSDIDIDYTVVAPAPTNLAISGKVLSWDAVAEADGYIIYADGEEIKTVSSNSYDFSQLTGAVIVFQVQTDAKRGYQNSGLSGSIAYVEDRTQAIADLDTLVGENFDGMPDGFAEALVEKGMVADDFDAFMTSLQTFTSDMEAAEGDILEMSNALHTLLAGDINFEALINGFILMLPVLIDDQIESMGTDIEYYQDYIDWGWDDDGYYQGRIDEIQAEIDNLETLKATLADSSDEVVLAALHTVEYFVSMINQLDTDFFTAIQNLTNVDNPADLDTEEIVMIKDELSAAMLDNMPTIEDMVALFEVLTAAAGSLSEDTTVVAYPTANAAQVLLSIEFFAKMIDTIDANFVNQIKVFAEDEETFELETIILAIKYFNTFQKDNDGLIQEMRDVLSFEQRQALFEGYLTMVSDMDPSVPATILSISFADIDTLDQFAYDLMDPILKWFDDTDGEILRAIYEYQMDQSYTFYTSTDLTERQKFLQTNLDLVNMVEQMVTFAFIITDEVNEEVAQAFVRVVLSSIPYEEYGFYDSTNISEAEYEELAGDLIAVAESNIMTLVGMVKDAELTAVDGFFDDWTKLENDLDEYLAGEYGADYADGSDYYYDDVYSYSRPVLLAKFLDEFLDSGTKADAQDILDAAFVILNNSLFQKNLDMTSAEAQEMITNIQDHYDDLLVQIAIVADINVFNMDEADMTAVDDLMNILG